MTFPILTLTGSPRSRGEQHGRAFAMRVRCSIATYARLFAYYRGVDWDEMQRRATAFLPLLENTAPHLLDEMRGIAIGAGVAFEEILALNTRTELLAGASFALRHSEYDAAMGRNRMRDVPQHTTGDGLSAGEGPNECTTLAAQPSATADGRTWLAQNWDWSGEQRKACVLLRVHETGKPDLLTMTEGGIVGKIGLNSAGVAVCMNILASELDGRAPGMPIHVLLRLMLESASFDDAIARAQSPASGASSCVTIASADGRMTALEITPGGVGELHPVDGVLVHANHCVCETTMPIASVITGKSSTLPRYARGTALLEEARGRIDLTALQTMLRDRDGGVNAICRYADPALHPVEQVEAVCGIVMDVAGGVMHIAADVPERAPFEAMRVS
ncbi:MAG: C45 family autoproteolytic acyltransferase/hydrolase [Chloroflexi bacterium]|nr:C45 family autoproteolytic acyltransferase/hydrolase [Chloroflexota bacterium]